MKYINRIWNIRWDRKRTSRIVFVLVLAMGIVPLMRASASRTSTANDKKNEAEQALNATQSDISRIEAEQDQLQAEIDALDAELVQVIMDLSILEGDIANAQANLEVIQADLAQAEIDEKNQYESMKKRIRFMYERGDKAFLVSILESQSITELLNRVEYVNEVYDYDRELLVSYQITKLQVAELKTQVQSEIAGMEELQANYQEEQERYESMIAQRRSQMDDFDSQLASAKKLAAKYQATIEEQNEIIRQEEERLRREEEERKRQEEEARKRQEEEERKRQEEEERRRQEEAANAGSSSGGNTDNTDNTNSNSGGSSSQGDKNPAYVTDISGSAVVDYACQFIGNPYVFGGTDINNGIDCSAYVRYVFANFGISLPRTSYEQRVVGKEVSYSNAQPGDIICYSGHVAIYIGNGQIVHASNSAPYPAGGIKISNATYRTILSVRRVL